MGCGHARSARAATRDGSGGRIRTCIGTVNSRLHCRCATPDRSELEPAAGGRTRGLALTRRALFPLSYAGELEPEEGFEPAIPWVRARCPPVGRLRCAGRGGAIRTLVCGFKGRGPASGRLPREMERAPGVEPGSSGWKPDASAARPCPRSGATGGSRTRVSALGGRCLTARPRSLEDGGCAGIRTQNQRLKRPLRSSVAPRTRRLGAPGRSRTCTSPLKRRLLTAELRRRFWRAGRRASARERALARRDDGPLSNLLSLLFGCERTHRVLVR